jgi:hypothetical protein
MRRIALSAVLALLFVAGSTAARNPWQLTCPAMPFEQATPAAVRSAAHAFFPWVPNAKSLRAGPVYLIALSTHTAISRDGDDRDSSDNYLHRALIAIAPSLAGGLTIGGHRLGKRARRTALGFSISGATHCAVHTPVVSCGSHPLRFAPILPVKPRHGWRIVRTELRIGRTGCFRLIVSGPNLHETIPLAVPGPDYGTSRW